MAIITISRQPYSFGDEIAQEIAKKLNYKLIDKFIINNKVKDFHCNFSDELHDLANEKEPGFFKHFFKNPEVYNCLVQAILFEEASHDNIVIKGRGGQYILNQPYVLKIRIMAPFNVRCSYLEKKERVNHSLAEKLLAKKDHEREYFIRYLFKKDISKTNSYDLIFTGQISCFDHYKLGADLIISTILDYAKKIEKTQPLTENNKDNLKRLSLEKRVEATIKKEISSEHVDLNIGCEKLGDIKITGFVADEIERNKIFKLAQLCHGVNSVDNQLSVT